MTSIRETLLLACRSIVARDAEVLLCFLLHRDLAWLRAHAEEALPASVAAKFNELVSRRSAGEPLQYIMGTQEFFGLPMRVGPGVLIPRPETEHLVEAVLTWAAREPPNLKIIDVGTGSGAIAIALAKNLPESSVIAIDISAEALSIAKENAVRTGVAERIQFVQADLLEVAECGSVDVIVSNPPYVPLKDAEHMQIEVVDHEPHLALFAGEDGLDVFLRLIPQAQAALRPDGLLALEMGWGQREAISALLRSWNRVHFIEDYAGTPRVALAERR